MDTALRGDCFAVRCLVSSDVPTRHCECPLLTLLQLVSWRVPDDRIGSSTMLPRRIRALLRMRGGCYSSTETRRIRKRKSFARRHCAAFRCPSALLSTISLTRTLLSSTAMFFVSFLQRTGGGCRLNVPWLFWWQHSCQRRLRGLREVLSGSAWYRAAVSALETQLRDGGDGDGGQSVVW